MLLTLLYFLNFVFEHRQVLKPFLHLFLFYQLFRLHQLKLYFFVLKHYHAKIYLLNLLAHLIGKPGKMDVSGDMVQDLFEQGERARINDYCRCDVLDTYFVFLRTNVLIGNLTLEQEQQRVHQAKQWIESNTEQHPVYQQYLDNWGDWNNPWG